MKCFFTSIKFGFKVEVDQNVWEVEVAKVIEREGGSFVFQACVFLSGAWSLAELMIDAMIELCIVLPDSSLTFVRMDEDEKAALRKQIDLCNRCVLERFNRW
jgi:hypothetical protein